MIMRSAKVPLSPSSALQTMYLRGPCASAAVFHLIAGGKARPAAPAQTGLRDFLDRRRVADLQRALQALQAAMGHIIRDRKRIDNAATREGEPRLSAHPGVIFDNADAARVRAASEEIRVEQRGDVRNRDWPVADAATRRFHLDQRLKPSHAARAGADDLDLLPTRGGFARQRVRHIVGAQPRARKHRRG